MAQWNQSCSLSTNLDEKQKQKKIKQYRAVHLHLLLYNTQPLFCSGVFCKSSEVEVSTFQNAQDLFIYGYH